MNNLEKIETKIKIKEANGLDTSKEKRALVEKLAKVLEFVDNVNKESEGIMRKSTFDECEEVLRERVEFSDDDKVTFANLLEEAKRHLAYLNNIYSKYGFCDKFAWELIYMDVLSGKLYFTGFTYYEHIKVQEDEYTAEVTPANYRVKNLKKETKELLKKGGSLLTYIERNLRLNDLPHLHNGVSSFHVLFYKSAYLTDKYHGRN